MVGAAAAAAAGGSGEEKGIFLKCLGVLRQETTVI